MRAKNIRNIFILAALFLLLFLEAGFVFDDQETGAFNRANVYYEQGNFDEAIKQYKSIVEEGLESGNLYYNLGNCYFKKGKLGEAIFYYEKARRLIPRDRDLESNYEYACSLIKGGTFSSQESFPARLWNKLFEKLAIDGLTLALSIFFISILISILASLFFAPLKKQALILTAFLGLCFVVGLVGLKGKISRLNKEAIVVVEQADAKFEPMEKATTYFTLYEGMKVEVVESRDNWHKVKRQDKKSGWVQYSAILPF
ncbi:MAG: tetratricopeptide repeat protein [Candidatus Omnitrophota bacterium]|jgi:tetratricopeptide (TPR) repeat protein|nr:MAG: tetratricopeptide repeat protein [Candidatus Omnitrophota bacterium]